MINYICPYLLLRLLHFKILGKAQQKKLLTNLDKSYLLGNTLMLACGGRSFPKEPRFGGEK
jgi:hypothetical protein